MFELTLTCSDCYDERVRPETLAKENMFSRKLSNADLAEWLRSLHVPLKAGLSIRQVLQKASSKGSGKVRELNNRLLAKIEAGDDFAEAIKNEKESLPPLVLSLASVGNQAGHLPEIMKRMETYFRFLVKLKREFWSQVTFPLFQFIAAILIIALLIVILGMLPRASGQKPMDVLGLGLVGFTGATIWLGFWVLLIVLLWMLYQLSRKTLAQSATVDRLLLRIPAVGPCLESLALSRMSVALGITMSTGMNVLKAMRQSIAASENGAFQTTAEPVTKEIKAGSSISESLRSHSVYPSEFVDIVETAESAGTLSESMMHQADLYNEQALHRLSILNKVLGFVVWAVVAGIIIVFIFRIFTIAYLNPMRDALKGF